MPCFFSSCSWRCLQSKGQVSGHVVPHLIRRVELHESHAYFKHLTERVLCVHRINCQATMEILRASLCRWKMCKHVKWGWRSRRCRVGFNDFLFGGCTGKLAGDLCDQGRELPIKESRDCIFFWNRRNNCAHTTGIVSTVQTSEHNLHAAWQLKDMILLDSQYFLIEHWD